jgi:hypothetical protein
MAQRNDLMCSVQRLAYDFEKGSGELYMDDGHCCDMVGCVALFESIDPKVATIQTFSGAKQDTAYRRSGSEWVAVL